MAAKYQLITELYRRTGVSVAKSPQAWQSFLSSACRNYKCRFDEQLLIYAQRPDAVAVAELGTWNKLFKRWVNKDSKGIAVFDPKGRRNTLKYYFDISDTHEGYYGSRPVPIWQMDERYEQAVKERLSDRFGEIEETDLAETLFKTAENAVEDNLPDYLSQLKSVTQDSFLEGLDEYNIEVLYKRLAVNSVAFMLMSRCGLDVKEYFDREDFADIVNFNTPHTINAIGIATSDISEMALREISAAIRNVQMEARGENRTFAPKSQSRYDVGRKQPERSENNERNHIHKAGGLSYSRPNITDRARASAWQIRYDAQGVSGAAQESDLSEPADRGDAKSASLRGGTDGTQTVGASDEAALNGAGRDGGTEGKSPDAVGRIDEQHPQPSGGSHLDGTDLQLSIANEEEVSANLPTVEQQIEKITQAEDEKSSAFVVSQEDIDSVLQMGSSYDKSKYRIYRQLQKNSDSKTNIEFLKKEYGTGGGTHIFPDGTQGGRWADSKGKATVSAVKAIIAGTKALIAAIVAGGWVAVIIILIVVLLGCAVSLFGGGGNSNAYTPVSAEVEAYDPLIRQYASQHGIPEYVELIKAVMMQESGGRGNDPMQASECGYNTRYPNTPNGITDPEYSIDVGIQNLADCLNAAEVENPVDMEHIKLALQGYNFGNGYISWAKNNYGGYSYANAVEFSAIQAERLGWDSYGDTQYVAHVLRYYPYGRAFTSGGNQAIVEVALTQLGNVGGEPYWSWYGFDSRVEWCACFVSWCAEQCGYLESGIIPKYSLCSDGVNWFRNNGQWQGRDYEPTAGNLIFFDWEGDGTIDHTGIVEKSENGTVYTVEGNSGDECKQRNYPVGSSVIYGYGIPAY